MLNRLTARPRILLLLTGLVAAATVVLLVGRATDAPADANDNTVCWGNISKGTPDPDDPTVYPVKYKIRCDGPITGYSFNTAPERVVQSAETEVFVSNDDAGTDVIPSDSFSCNGQFPGYGVNCVGPPGSGYLHPYAVIVGQFFVDRDPCVEPRLDPLMTASYASLNSKGQIAQSMSGPFDFYFSLACRGKVRPRRVKNPWVITPPKIPLEHDVAVTNG